MNYAHEITPEALARSYRDAAEAIESGEFLDFECCGHRVGRLGLCLFREGHPTPAHPAITSYPESYDSDGRLIR